MVEYTDFIVGKIMQAINEQGFRKNTYIFFTTDNGTTPSMIGKRNNTYVRGGKTYLTENGINAPFIVQTPVIQKKGESIALIDFTDIFPTLLDLAEIEWDEQNSINGISFAPVLSQPETKGPREWISALGSYPATLDENRRMRNYHRFRDRIIANDRYKVYIDTTGNLIRLYNLLEDPNETKNLINEAQEKETIRYFQKILAMMPIQDNQSKYIKFDTTYYNVPVDILNEKSHKAHVRNLNMSAMATKEDFVKQKKN